MHELTQLADELADIRNERHVVEFAIRDDTLMVETDGEGFINPTSFQADVAEVARFTGEDAQEYGAEDGNHMVAFQEA